MTLTTHLLAASGPESLWSILIGPIVLITAMLLVLRGVLFMVASFVAWFVNRHIVYHLRTHNTVFVVVSLAGWIITCVAAVFLTYKMNLAGALRETSLGESLPRSLQSPDRLFFVASLVPVLLTIAIASVILIRHKFSAWRERFLLRIYIPSSILLALALQALLVFQPALHRMSTAGLRDWFDPTFSQNR